MKYLLFNGYKNYTTSNDIHKCANEACGNLIVAKESLQSNEVMKEEDYGY